MAEQLQNTQFCGVPGNYILDALSQIRSVIAHAENTGIALCILTLDFHNTFDRISQNYVFRNLQQYGIRQCFIERLRETYSDATASVQINDTLADPISIQCGVRKGCPLSMALYALCLQPLLCALDHNIQGLRGGRRKRCRPVLAYADDVTVFVTHPTEFATIVRRYSAFSEPREHSSTLPNRKQWPLAVGKSRRQS